MLEEKHTKMVHIIGQEVDKLRKDINFEKERYVEVVEEKRALMKYTEKIKEMSLKFIADKNEVNEVELLQALDGYNRRYNPKSMDVSKTMDLINDRKLIEIIEREEMEDDEEFGN